MFLAAVLVVVTVVFLIFSRRGPMDRSKQAYGYIVCLIAVVTMLISASGIINGLFDSARPEMSREIDSSLRTFDAYKQSRIDRLTQRTGQGRLVIDVNLPADSVLARTFQTERKYQIDRVRYHANRRIVTSGILLLIAASLFAAHWRWLRRLAHTERA